LLVAHSDAFAGQVQAAFPDTEVVARPRPGLRSYLRALRPHQWAKNILLLLPMFAGHRFDLHTLWVTGLAFACFCLSASSAYVINDLLDLPADRDHPRKRNRPFASASLPIMHGVLMSAGCLLAGFLLSLALPLQFTGILALYVVCTLAYSFALKRRLLIDVVVLSGLYTLRVYGGLAAMNVRQTQWLLMFSLFLFLSLAILKRAEGKPGALGRGYRVEDLAILFPLGAAAGYGSVFVVALYASSPEVRALYSHPNRLWLICPLLVYWLSRVLLKANRGEMHDDPLIFALTDRVSWAAAAGAAFIVLFSV
jgi:4-hydroxybenzoate polyprenyltransferase